MQNMEKSYEITSKRQEVLLLEGITISDPIIEGNCRSTLNDSQLNYLMEMARGAISGPGSGHIKVDENFVRELGVSARIEDLPDFVTIDYFFYRVPGTQEAECTATPTYGESAMLGFPRKLIKNTVRTLSSGDHL